jgi:hypothetical protein
MAGRSSGSSVRIVAAFQSQRIAAYLFLAVAVGSIVLAIVEYNYYSGSRRDIVVSVILAVLFFCLGGLREYSWAFRARNPSGIFAEMFRLQSVTRRQSTFSIVVPQFKVADNGMRTQIEHSAGLVYNPALGRMAPIVVDELISRNDSRAGGRIGSAIAGLTNGVFRPEFIGDDQLEPARLSEPALVIGSYSNNWIQSYWNYCTQSNRTAVFSPTLSHGLRIPSDDERPEFLPLDEQERPIQNFFESGRPAIEWDYGVFARVKGYDARNASWLVCAGIGPAATDGIALYLSGSADGRTTRLWRILVRYRYAEEFAVVFRVSARFVHNVTEVYSWSSAEASSPKPVQLAA